MNFQDFITEVIDEITVRSGGKYEAKKYERIKNNSTKRTGIVVSKEGMDIIPCLYLDDFFREYRDENTDIEKIMNKIYVVVTELMKDESSDIDLNRLKIWETVEPHIYPKLINADKNRDLLETVPNRLLCDMAVVYYIVIGDNGKGQINTVLATKEHLVRWRKNETDLYAAAIRNMHDANDTCFNDMETLMNSLMPDGFMPEQKDNIPDLPKMYVLTNDRKVFGASKILDKDVLQMVADKLGDRFVILPSSLHEVLILPSTDAHEYGYLGAMVQEVNDAAVGDEEQLSDHVYVYDINTDELTIVA